MVAGEPDSVSVCAGSIKAKEEDPFVFFLGSGLHDEVGTLQPTKLTFGSLEEETSEAVSTSVRLCPEIKSPVATVPCVAPSSFDDC